MEEGPNLEEAWASILKEFPILSPARPTPETCPKDNKISYEIISLIKRLKISNSIQDLIFSNIEDELRKSIVPTFWAYFKEPNHDMDGFQTFYKAVNFLFDHFVRFQANIAKLRDLEDNLTKFPYNQATPCESLQLIVKAVMLSQLPLNYQPTILNFYEMALKMMDPESGAAQEPGDHCAICLEEHNYCECFQMFNETNKKLGQMSLLEPLIGQTLTNLIYSYIQTHIQNICKDNFDTHLINSFEKWLQSVVIHWLKTIYCYDETKSSNVLKEELNKKLSNYLYNTYTKTRIDQLFNIIIEYPDSLPALEDLRLCLPKTDLKSDLTSTLQKSMKTRLLHPGVGTSDVLTAYIAAIKSLRVLDPSGLLLETITQPVHRYLKSREDTVRCVVSSLTEEGPNDLAEELIRGEAIQLDETSAENVDNWESWTPDPIDSISSKTSNHPRTSDIISMLVNVYGSKELFVNEYRTLLANRILSNYLCDTEKEIRYLELLKLRFGESQLHYCEVMLKDIADSKRINQNIQMDENYVGEDIHLSALILSAQFWPTFKEEKLELHRRVLEQIESYTDEFETLKGSRTLCWMYHLGVVELEIEMADRTLNLAVSPVHATILMHFQDQKTWTLEALGKKMHVPCTTLKKKINLWQSHGILTESEPDVYELQEEQEYNESKMAEDIVVEDSESESAMTSAQDQREDELQTFWSYITGMLMNLDTLPLERIHQMLKMFAFQGPTIECNLQELKVFLDRKVREHQLIFSNGLYKLPKY